MPDELKKNKSLKQGRARARMYLMAHLGWIQGFPVATGKESVNWVSIPTGKKQPHEKVTLTREELRKATFYWSKLVNHFPKALPQVLENYDAWCDGVPRILELVKSAIHDSEPMPSNLLNSVNYFSNKSVSTAHHLSNQNSELQKLTAALTWAFYLAPEQFQDAISWIESRQTELTALLTHLDEEKGIITCIQLWQLAAMNDPRRVDALLKLLADPRLFEVNTFVAEHEFYSWIRQIRTNKQHKFEAKFIPPEERKQPSGQKLYDWLQYLSNQSPKNQKEALVLFSVTYEGTTLTEWDLWWKEWKRLLKSTKRLFNKSDTSERREAASKLSEKIHQLKEQTPSSPDFDTVLPSIEEVEHLNIRGFSAKLSRVLGLIPVEERASFLKSHIWCGKQYSKKIVPFLVAMKKYASHAHSDWYQAWGAKRLYSPSNDILEQPIQLYPLIFEALNQCRNTQEKYLTDDEIEQIIELAAALNDPTEVAKGYQQLCKTDQHGEWIDAETFRIVNRLLTERKNFAAITCVLDEYEGKRLKEIAELESRLRDQGWNGFCEAEILEGNVERLIKLGKLLALSIRLKQQVFPLPRPSKPILPTWAKRFPAQSQPLIAILAILAPNAEEIIHRIFKKELPAPEQIKLEQEKLSALLKTMPEEKHLAKRIVNLDNRLNNPPPISPQRLANLNLKLVRAIRRTVLLQWEERLLNENLRFVHDSLGNREIPEVFQKPEHLLLLSAIMELSGKSRKLGLQLLKRRCGAPPWDLYGERANQEFIQRMEKRGLNLKTWLEPEKPIVWETTSGQTIFMGLEPDPLEVLHMGRHFDTCLSPESFNFFSAVSNAADANKQVVFARDAKGRVLGRCLLALTKQGGLLTFHPYAHDREIQFDKIMAEFAGQLAIQIGTASVSKGTVECLISPDWYDDGSIDLCGQFAFLKQGSEFRNSLEKIKPENFITVLEEQFSPLPINSLTLPLVLELSELGHRPELVLPLLPFLEIETDYPTDVFVRAATLAHAAGEFQFARQIMKTYGVRSILKGRGSYYFYDQSVMNCLVEYEPTLALRVLRKVRPRSVRKDEQETDPKQRQFLAQAHEKLGRHDLASRLREPVQKHHPG